MGLQFYKANAAAKGSATSLSFNSKDRALYISIIKQTSWNPTNRTGTFKGGQQCNVKFSLSEVGEFIAALKNNSEFKAFHSSASGTTQISFAPYIDKQEIQKGFGLKVYSTKGTEKTNFIIGFTFGEMEALSEYFKFVLNHFFSAIYSEDKKKALDKKKNAEEVLPEESSPEIPAAAPIEETLPPEASEPPQESGDIF